MALPWPFHPWILNSKSHPQLHLWYQGPARFVKLIASGKKKGHDMTEMFDSFPSSLQARTPEQILEHRGFLMNFFQRFLMGLAFQETTPVTIQQNICSSKTSRNTMMNEKKDLLNCSDKKMRYETSSEDQAGMSPRLLRIFFWRNTIVDYLANQAMHAKHGYPAQDKGNTWKYWDYQIVEASSDQGELLFNSVLKTSSYQLQESSPKSHL